jgi:hypothetical protein
MMMTMPGLCASAATMLPYLVCPDLGLQCSLVHGIAMGTAAQYPKRNLAFEWKPFWITAPSIVMKTAGHRLDLITCTVTML